jgi:para-nitrobenzyl esterase
LLSQFSNIKVEFTSANDSDGKTEFAKMLTLVNTDKVWAEPARFTARAFIARGTPAYVYLFSYVADSMRQRMRYGAAHASEIAYVFDNLKGRNAANVTPRDQEVARLMSTYWANFARSGDPNGKGLPKWPIFDLKKNDIFEFRTDGSALSGPDQRKARLDIMEKSATKQ